MEDEEESPPKTNTLPVQTWEDKVIRYGGWGLGVLMTLMLIAILFGKHFSGVLDSMGLGWLYHQDYCDKSENRSKSFCTGQPGGDEGWRDLKDTNGSPNGFSLH